MATTKIIIDIECDNLLYDATKIHCMSLRFLETNEENLYVTQESILDTLNIMQASKGDEIIGHNIFTFDNEVLKKLYNIDLIKTNKVIDTFVMSQVLCANLKNEDFGKWKDKIPKKLIGSHSLEAWGYRLGVQKGIYNGGFEAYNEEMGVYNLRDCEVTAVLYRYLESLIEERTWR